jgi:hypothetical protein
MKKILLLIAVALCASVHSQQTLPSQGGAAQIVNGTGTLNLAVDTSGNGTITPSSGTLNIAGALAPTTPLARAYGGSGLVEVDRVMLTDAASITNDISKGTFLSVVLAGNRTMLAPINVPDGRTVIYELIQDATGVRTLAWATNFLFGSGAVASPTLTTNALYHDFVMFKSSSTNSLMRCIGIAKGTL